MTVQDLIELLQMFPPTATVTALGHVIEGGCYERGDVDLDLEGVDLVDLTPPDVRVPPGATRH